MNRNKIKIYILFVISIIFYNMTYSQDIDQEYKKGNENITPKYSISPVIGIIPNSPDIGIYGTESPQPTEYYIAKYVGFNVIIPSGKIAFKIQYNHQFQKYVTREYDRYDFFHNDEPKTTINYEFIVSLLKRYRAGKHYFDLSAGTGYSVYSTSYESYYNEVYYDECLLLTFMFGAGMEISKNMGIGLEIQKSINSKELKRPWMFGLNIEYKIF